MEHLREAAVVDRGAWRGHKKREERERREAGGGEEEVAVGGKAMSHVSRQRRIQRMTGRLGREWRGGIETMGTTGVSNCRADKPQPRTY